MPSTVERKLTTILCADVEGYSRLMDRDEVGTLEILKRHRDALAGLIGRHRGRVVNTWGDGVIAEFPSVVEGVLCAVEAQKELRARNAGLATERRLEFRMGINVGDVMVEGHDLYGEGMNVAARLQALAAPGGIVISGSVHDQVRGKLVVGYEFAGPSRSRTSPSRCRPSGSGWTQHRHRGGEAGGDGARRPLGAQAAPAGRRWFFIGGALIGFLFLINMFANAEGGSTAIWFHWPALVIGFVMALRWAWTR